MKGRLILGQPVSIAPVYRGWAPDIVKQPGLGLELQSLWHVSVWSADRQGHLNATDPGTVDAHWYAGLKGGTQQLFDQHTYTPTDTRTHKNTHANRDWIVMHINSHPALTKQLLPVCLAFSDELVWTLYTNYHVFTILIILMNCTVCLQMMIICTYSSYICLLLTTQLFSTVGKYCLCSVLGLEHAALNFKAFSMVDDVKGWSHAYRMTGTVVCYLPWALAHNRLLFNEVCSSINTLRCCLQTIVRDPVLLTPERQREGERERERGKERERERARERVTMTIGVNVQFLSIETED